jgi:hypothetical protein
MGTTQPAYIIMNICQGLASLSQEVFVAKDHSRKELIALNAAASMNLLEANVQGS